MRETGSRVSGVQEIFIAESFNALAEKPSGCLQKGSEQKSKRKMKEENVWKGERELRIYEPARGGKLE